VDRRQCADGEGGVGVHSFHALANLCPLRLPSGNGERNRLGRFGIRFHSLMGQRFGDRLASILLICSIKLVSNEDAYVPRCPEYRQCGDLQFGSS